MCRTENRPDRRSCRSCGSQLGTQCRVCGAANEPGDRFCGTCGSSLDAGAATANGQETAGPIAPPAAGSPSGAAPSGSAAASRPSTPPSTERRLVSVLFADLVGSTGMAEGQDVEAVREALGRYYETARDIIGRYGGAIEKFIGDAVMAVWGSPVAHEDDAERAVRAALELVAAAATLRSPTGTPLSVRAGVLTGEAAVALDADGQGMVAGDLVNAASRLQSVAPPGAVLAGDATVRASEASIAYESAGELMLKGREAPVSAWRAVRVVAGRGGSKRAARLEAPFVGRDDELRLLKEVFHQTARERRPRLVSITGIAGIGKSRLAWELEKYIDGLVETVYWHQGRSPAYGEGLAFWALAEMVRGRARIAETDAPAEAREKLAAMATDLLPDEGERARVEPRLAALLGLEAAPLGGAEELTAAWRLLFERTADRGPTVLVFEDLHWAEGGLLDFIEALLASARSRPILVVALARPELIERRPTWGVTVRNHLRLDLAPLDDESMDVLLLGLAPGIPQDALRVIRQRAEGIPLYAVETVRMLLDQGRLTETDGRFRLVGDLGSLAVPESLQALLGSRLDALDPELRDLVGHAAVLGISFTVEATARLSGRTTDDVRNDLDALVARELLVFDDDPRSSERGQYAFLQGVLREVAYARLSRRERLARHLSAAEYFEELDSDELAGVVATHYVEALQATSDDDRRREIAVHARGALESAAARAHAVGAYASAARYLGEAVPLADDESDSIRLREARLHELYDAAASAEVEAEAHELIGLGRDRGDPDLVARAGYDLAGALVGAGRPRDAVTELLAIETDLGESATATPDGLRFSAELARCYLMSGDPATAAKRIEAILPVAERLGLRDVVAELLPSKGWALAAAGRPLEAMAVQRGALDLAERDERFRAEMRARMNFSALEGWEDVREAFEIARTGIERARERGFDKWASSLAGNACGAAVPIGEWEQALRLVDELGLGEQKGPWEQSPVLTAAVIHAYRGALAEAERLYERAESITGSLVDPQLQYSVVGAAAELAFARGELDQAAARMEDVRRIEASADQPRDPLGGFIALERGDLELVRVEAAAPPLGRMHGSLLRGFHGAAAVLSGDHTGLLAMDAAAEALRSDGVRFYAALVSRARAMLASSDAGARPAAELAAATFRELGAVTMFRGIERLVTPFDAASGPSDAAGETWTSPALGSGRD
jgi:class 3 adenylate cyclase/tetratricopeptide (TPR) repeat protein